MKKAVSCMAVVLAFLMLDPLHAEESKCSLTVGASLHPYYSWAKNIVGDAAVVMPLIPSGSDPHAYQPLPSDMEMLSKLDVVIVNGVGHDEFVKPMLKAIDNPKLQVVDTSKGLPLIPSFDNKHYAFEEKEEGPEEVSYNSHTYISITGAIQQMQMIARSLGKLCPDHAAEFMKNMRGYAARLRSMLQDTLMRIDGLDLANLRIATVHDGYSYLFQDLGIEVSAVVQPRHGVTPSAKQLEDTIKRIKKAKVNVLFGELDYEKKYVDIIYQETGCRMYALSHVSNGEYTKEHFEKTMQKNMDIIVAALSESAGVGKSSEIPASVQKNISSQVKDTASRMQDAAKENLQSIAPGVQEKQQNLMKETQQARQVQQVEATSQKMQETVKENLQSIVPEVQEKQQNLMKQTQQAQQAQDTAQKMQEAAKENLQSIVPEVRRKQQEAARQDLLESAAPAAPSENAKQP